MSRLARFRSIVSRPLITRMLHDSKLPYVVVSDKTEIRESGVESSPKIKSGFLVSPLPWQEVSGPFRQNTAEIWMTTRINNDAENDEGSQTYETEDPFNDRED